MKKMIKIISILVISGYFLLITSSSRAFISPQEDMIFAVSRDYQGICYQKEALCIPVAVCYRQTGEIIPIYNLKREKLYLTANASFYTTIDKIVNNDKVRRVLLYGYPNVSFQELGCISEEEACIITQIALLNVYYQYNLEDFTVTNKNQYPNILVNLRNLIQKVENATEVYEKPELIIDDENIEWEKGENQDSKTYKVISNSNFKNYTITIKDQQNSNIKIVNEKDESKSTFSCGEKFKIMVPSQENINFTIQVTAEFETTPVREGNSISEEWEKYVLLDNSEIVTDTLNQVHTKIVDSVQNPKPDEEKPSNPQEETIIETQIEPNKKLPVTGF